MRRIGPGPRTGSKRASDPRQTVRWCPYCRRRVVAVPCRCYWHESYGAERSWTAILLSPGPPPSRTEAVSTFHVQRTCPRNGLSAENLRSGKLFRNSARSGGIVVELGGTRAHGPPWGPALSDADHGGSRQVPGRRAWRCYEGTGERHSRARYAPASANGH